MTIDIVQNTLSAGEISPHLYGRTDLAKYHTGAMRMENFFVDYRGGASNRPGTQIIGETHVNSAGRLARFDFGLNQTYVLVFTSFGNPVSGEVQFIKNYGGPSHVNGSNSFFIMDPVTPTNRYSVVTPYILSDLPDLKFSQSADVFIITHPLHKPMQLIRLADDNWTLSEYVIGNNVVIPTGMVPSITGLPAGSTDPQNTNYNYVVTAIDQDGNESEPSFPASITGINIAATQGTVGLTWTGVDDAQFYFVYRAIPSPGGVIVPPTASFGFLGIAYGPIFYDSNIIADFSQGPPSNKNPFANGQVIGYRITNPGATYPVRGTVATVVDPNGATATLIPIVNTRVEGGTAAILGFVIKNAGHDIADGAAITVTGTGGSGFAGTVHTTAPTGAFPRVSAYFQSRIVFASTVQQPLSLFGSRIGLYKNFSVSNPVNDADAFEFTINSQQIAEILYLIPMPGGLVILTDNGVIQLTGGSGNPSNPSAVTPSSAVIIPQSYYGAQDGLEPIVINYDILYAQFGGNIVRDLSYNFLFNIYTGTDVTILSNHLFAPTKLVRWAYQDLPNKIVWAARSDGALLSLTYLKEQDVYGWARHYSHGRFRDAVSVHEGAEDAVYFIVDRNGIQCIERLASRQTSNIRDAWFLDSAVSNNFTFPNATLTVVPAAATVGATDVPFYTDVDTFDAFNWVGARIQGMNNSLGSALVTQFIGPREIRCTIIEPWIFPIEGQFWVYGNWASVSPIATMGNLAHLEGLEVMALVDGKTQGPFIVEAGNIALSSPGFNVLVGMPYLCRLQQLPPEGPQGGLAGRRNRTVATTTKVMYTDVDSLKIGSSLNTLKPFRIHVSSTDTAWLVPDTIAGVPLAPVGLWTGDMRMHIDAKWHTQGGVALETENPVPVTVLSFINEIDIGGARAG